MALPNLRLRLSSTSCGHLLLMATSPNLLSLSISLSTEKLSTCCTRPTSYILTVEVSVVTDLTHLILCRIEGVLEPQLQLCVRTFQIPGEGTWGILSLPQNKHMMNMSSTPYFTNLTQMHAQVHTHALMCTHTHARAHAHSIYITPALSI